MCKDPSWFSFGSDCKWKFCLEIHVEIAVIEGLLLKIQVANSIYLIQNLSF